MDVSLVGLSGWEKEVHHNAVSDTCMQLGQMEPDSHYRSHVHHISLLESVQDHKNTIIVNHV